ncbi:hypothetical protein [Propionibacterium freudenreichii]|nr:hypothetical protein [Propionibacterium freudenreichii]SCQ47318.1 Hypothetical protein PFR_JS7-1_2180 [Propionibacterium freudenreichii]SCQ55188.1 Hypothetical protein PFR_JS7-2_2123 [Propionibacterium freudenreichii]
MKNILLVDSNGSRRWLLRRILRLGYRVTVLGLEGRTHPVEFDSLGEQYSARLLPSYRDESLDQFCADYPRPDAVLAWNHYCTRAASELARRWSLPGAWMVGARPYDKLFLANAWSDEGESPKTHELTRDYRPSKFPQLIKPRCMAGSKGMRFCRDEDEYLSISKHILEDLDDTGSTSAGDGLAVLHGLEGGEIVQDVLVPDQRASGEEFSLEFVITPDSFIPLDMYVRRSTGRPYYLTISHGGRVLEVDREEVLGQLGRVESLVRRAGMTTGVGHLEFCFVGGRLVPFELNPRLIGDPMARLLDMRLNGSLPKILTELFQFGGLRTSVGRLSDLHVAMRHLRVLGSADSERFIGLGMPFQNLDSGTGIVDIIENVKPGGSLHSDVEGRPLHVASLIAASREPGFVARAVDAAGQSRIALDADGGVDDASAGRRIHCEVSSELPSTFQPDLPRDVFSSRSWLAAAGEMPGSTGTKIVQVCDDRGRVLAALPFWVVGPGISSSHRPPGMAGAKPVLLVGSRAGYSVGSLFAIGLSQDERRRYVSLMLERLRHESVMLGIEEAWLMYCTSEFLEIIPKSLSARRIPERPICEVVLQGRGYLDWLDDQSRKVRARVRKDSRRELPVGTDECFAPLREVLPDVANLFAINRRKYEHSGLLSNARGYLDILDRSFGDQAQVVSLVTGGRMRAFSLCLSAANVYDSRVYGSDGSLDSGVSAYFRLAIVRNIQMAVCDGASRVTFGPGAYQAKLGRGLSLSPRWSVPLVSAVESGSQRSEDALVEEFSSLNLLPQLIHAYQGDL